ncbi:TraB/GumN family protein [Oleiagrimonas sp. MCCC 1A03011]|uniref:TraB/GumN family protein n=1 Tax=Oleiagrimonas sp. MCCC 1A03011 TaxID=1926883 RepID=UPI000DC4A708|nr:TraB/GumN family protein [Oleiagrimonas sp. MCCC 1A03011]RAP57403.1 TraB/GumN family protein [Oleiagrimonas sp. MCCC 1A03011]
MTLLQRLARLAVVALALLALPALAQPALWVAHSGNSTLYLFGTVHLLPDHMNWHDAQLDKALKSSKTLYIELTDDNQANVQMLALKYGLDLSHPLSSKVNEADMHRLQQAARVAGLPGGEATLEPMRPWLAGLTLSVAPLLKAGMDPNSGVDKQLKAQFEQAGKPVKGLETAEQQIRFFADMPPAMELAFLHSVLKDFGNAKKDLNELIGYWQSGNVDAIARKADLKLRKQAPGLYKRLIADRNARWGRKLHNIMQTPGVYFVAVGAAHLAGPDSVQMQLAKHGIQTRRLP